MLSFQPTMQVHDDLATLFSRNLTFNPEAQSQASSPPPKPEEQVVTQHACPPLDLDPAPTNPNPNLNSNMNMNMNMNPNPKPIIYSITQHYTHSAHVVRQNSTAQTGEQQPQQGQGQGQKQAQVQQQQQQVFESQRPASEPPQSEQLTSETLLAQNGVDPAVLSPSQVQLFRISDPVQQFRLVELWRVAPPSRSLDNPAFSWTTTTLEQEELWARLRYERQLEGQRQDSVMSLDGTQVQSNDGRWLSPSLSHNVEPYMMSGYEELMRREEDRRQAESKPKGIFSHFGSSVGYSRATDPVYKGSSESWPQNQQQQQQQQQQIQMENQYGAFQQHQFGGPSGNMEAMDIM